MQNPGDLTQMIATAIAALHSGKFGSLSAKQRSHLKQAERALERLQQWLAQPDSVRVHELRMFVIALYGAADLFAREVDGPLTPPQHEIVALWLNSARAIREIVENP